MNLTELYSKLFALEVIKFGEFKLKSGFISPIYFDLRTIVSYPEVLAAVADAIWAKTSKLEFDCICGVPYTALPIATCISVKHNVPMVMRRKETKDYGTKKMLEGSFKRGDRCLIVEDVVSTGSSVKETADILRAEGLIVEDAIVFLEREMGGLLNLKEAGINLRFVMNISDILVSLQAQDKITDKDCERVSKFLTESFQKKAPEPSSRVMSIKDRRSLLTNDTSVKLLDIINSKQTNLCVSADVTTCDELLQIAETLGPYICVLKTHVDILSDLTLQPDSAPPTMLQLRSIAEKHKFLIMEDRKFSDIGNTFLMQCFGGPFRIAEWAQLVTAHAISGPGMLTALKAQTSSPPAVVFVSQMSCKANLISEEYTKKTVELAGAHKDLVGGFVYRSYSSVRCAVPFMRFMPGIGLSEGGDGLDQQYVTCEAAIGREKCDVIIVGRAILNSPDRVVTAKKLRDSAWAEYSAANRLQI